MLDRIRSRAVWMAVGLVFGGAALATAGGTTSVGDSSAPDPIPSASKDAKPDKDEREAAREERKALRTDGEREHNHGYYVSRAAKCEPVGEGGTTFEPPTDCSGEAKGDYVSSVAQSDLGKKPKPTPSPSE